MLAVGRITDTGFYIALRKHGQEVANFNLDLDTEATIFRNTCENLLEPHLSPGTIDRLTASAATNEELRRDLDNLNEVLNVKLRPNALKSFLANMEEMKKLLDELAKTYPVEDLEALAVSPLIVNSWAITGTLD